MMATSSLVSCFPEGNRNSPRRENSSALTFKEPTVNDAMGTEVIFASTKGLNEFTLAQMVPVAALGALAPVSIVWSTGTPPI